MRGLEILLRMFAIVLKIILQVLITVVSGTRELLMILLDEVMLPSLEQVKKVGDDLSEIITRDLQGQNGLEIKRNEEGVL